MISMFKGLSIITCCLPMGQKKKNEGRGLLLGGFNLLYGNQGPEEVASVAEVEENTHVWNEIPWIS